VQDPTFVSPLVRGGRALDRIMDYLSLVLSTSSRKSSELSFLCRIVYCSLQFGIIFCVNSSSLGFNMYIEAVGVSVGMMGILQLFIRTLDLFVTFAVGPLTDKCETPCGKRKPFLLFGEVLLRSLAMPFDCLVLLCCNRSSLLCHWTNHGQPPTFSVTSSYA